LIILQLIGADLRVVVGIFQDALYLKTLEALLPKACASLTGVNQPVPIEEPGVARACGHRPALHPFIMANLSKRGLWDESPFLQQLSNGTYPIAILPFDPQKGATGVHAERWTPGMIEAFANHYQVLSVEQEWRILQFKP
jgi:hypothetical protein